MDIQKIKVRTESGQTLEAEVVTYKADGITVLLGQGEHSMRCKLLPTRNGLGYAGTVMGREIIYEHSVKQVSEEVARKEKTPERRPVRR